MLFIIFILSLLVFAVIFYTFNFSNVDETSSIYTVNSIFPPTIINDQYYYFVKTNYNNISFNQCIKSNDFVSDFIKKNGMWAECLELYDAYNKCSKNGVFLDIGANIGSCSFLFAEIGVRVFAFEPLANNLFPFSITTYSNSKFKKYITIFPYAIGKKEKQEIIHIQKNNWGASSMYVNNSDYNQTINVKKLDDFDKVMPYEISVIKIDVEGAEYDLFEGAKNFFKYHKAEYMFIESTCGEKNENGIYKIEKLYNTLNEMGYEVIKKIDCAYNSKLNYNFVAKNKS